MSFWILSLRAQFCFRKEQLLFKTTQFYNRHEKISKEVFSQMSLFSLSGLDKITVLIGKVSSTLQQTGLQ